MSKKKPTTSQTITKIFSSRKILLDLAKARGFDVDNYTSFTISEVLVLHNNKQLDMLVTNNETNRKIYYKYHHEVKLRSVHIEDYIEDLFSVEEILEEGDEIIIVTKDRTNDALKNLLKLEYTRNSNYVNVYNLNNYLYNILDNNLVPDHKTLTQERKEEIALEYNIVNDTQWPEISRFDPVAMAIGLRPGKVVEITRNSPTALETKYYRFCK
jgi:DNA-directed RNA polymerase subunit H